jgi:uroporphyrinogen-III decarboxylase
MLYPAKYSGKPYWEVLYEADPPVWKMTADLAGRFGFDAMIQVALDKSAAERERESAEVIEKTEDHRLVKYSYRTEEGLLEESVLYPADSAPWRREPLVKNVEEDYRKILALLRDPGEREAQSISDAKEYLGDHGIVGDYLGVPSFSWCLLRGSIQDAIMDYYDYPEIMNRITEVYTEYGLEYIRASCEKAAPDYFMFGGSYASMSVISPEFYRSHNLAFVQRCTALLKERGVPSCLHMCGRSNEMIGAFASETDLNMLEPLERPPGGNVNLKETKRRYGDRLCLKGNINTFDTLQRGSPAEVETEARRCMEDAAGGGGFILASGDQVPRDTPEENFISMIGAAEKYGRYG